MIGGQAIRFDNYIIINIFILDENIAAQMIVSYCHAFLWHLKADDMPFAVCNAPRRFIRIEPAAQCRHNATTLCALVVLCRIFSSRSGVQKHG